MPITALVCGFECCTLRIQQLNQFDVEMEFLRWVDGYALVDRKNNKGV